ncbi:lactam utilization protein LamB [Penicillium chermesinum]|uniref:Lactam utilization protein LamB n=1 Tax=Penicillium chermesinum TaxID=63820 RepID=A0A9W9PJQ9_9EURO|nr:lactam utilization protein LamB [Penicillium chermesinum]KAJ5248715.1 lactam utilization protein LamB [Penicillium chermesinum]
MAPTQTKALINVDMGEGYGNFICGPDKELLPMIDQANVACGFHAGDPMIMAETVALCKAHNVKIGAHPGLPDVQGFGRREIKFSPEEHTANVVYQIGALKAFLDREGLEMHHVKPHGILYGMMARDLEIARAVWAAVPKGMRVFGLAGSHMETAAKEAGLVFWAEYFADVKYRADGTLIIDRKKQPWDPEDVRKHVSKQLYEGRVFAATGEDVDLQIEGTAGHHMLSFGFSRLR